MNGAMSWDGNWTALATRKGEIFLFTAAGSATPIHWASRGKAVLMRFLPNGSLLVDRTIWQLTPAPHPVAQLATDFDVISEIAVNARGDRLAAANADTTVRVYDTASWKPVFVNRDLLMEPFGIAFTPDGSRLVIGGADYRLTILDALSGKRIAALPPFRNAYISNLKSTNNDDWFAVELSSTATADPIGWRFVNLKSGRQEPVCAKGERVRFAGAQPWCFDARRQTLEPAGEPSP